MSEYQYYEFQAIDRPLTKEEMAELRDISSRAQISSRRFVNEYNWGSLKADPVRLMARYFDAGLHLANWGARLCMFRLPAASMPRDEVMPYCNNDTLTCRFSESHIVVSIATDVENPGWIEGQDELETLLPLRESLMQGDRRALFIAWLRGIQDMEYDEDETDTNDWGADEPAPPIPPDLSDLTVPLKELAEFIDLSPDLLATAAEHSATAVDTAPTAEEIARYIAALSPEIKDNLLAGIITGQDPRPVVEFRRKALKFFHRLKTDHAAQDDEPLRIGQLLKRAMVIGQERIRREVEKRDKANAHRVQQDRQQRKEHLESLAGQDKTLWGQIDALIGSGQPKKYDSAVKILQDLRDLATMQDAGEAFARRMNELGAACNRKPSLIARLHKAGLLP